MVGVKPGDSGVIGKVSALTCFSLEVGCEDHSTLHRKLKNSSMVMILSSQTHATLSELDASCDEASAMASSVCSGCLCSVNTISYNPLLQPAPSIKYQKSYCQARALLLPVPYADKISAAILIHYFSSCTTALDFGFL